jgi:type I restriction enzyme S subunit
VNKSLFATFEVPITTIEEQERIAQLLDACDAKCEVLEDEIRLLDELFRTLLEELMSGRLSDSLAALGGSPQ